jgi:preprotein translocase subunit SecF
MSISLIIIFAIVIIFFVIGILFFVIRSNNLSPQISKETKLSFDDVIEISKAENKKSLFQKTQFSGFSQNTSSASTADISSSCGGGDVGGCM